MNPEIVAAVAERGLRFVGHDESGQRQEIIELPQDVHPYYVAYALGLGLCALPHVPLASSTTLR